MRRVNIHDPWYKSLSLALKAGEAAVPAATRQFVGTQ
jgi:hypothetical protein